MKLEDFPEVIWESRDNLPAANSKIAVVSSSGKVRIGVVLPYPIPSWIRVYVRRDLTISWDSVVSWTKVKNLNLGSLPLESS
jgi:hypothetical protein